MKRLFPYLLILCVVVLFIANILCGSVKIPVGDVLSILFGNESLYPSWSYIIWESRFPQALTAMLTGAALSTSGLMLQTSFNNPLAGPDILGINSGAGLGAAIVLLLFGGIIPAGNLLFSGSLALVAAAFVGALAVTALILLFASRLRSHSMLLIIGMMIGYVVSSAVSLLNFFSTAEGVQSYMMWGMGNFGGVSRAQLPLFGSLTLIGLGIAISLVKPLNALLSLSAAFCFSRLCPQFGHQHTTCTHPSNPLYRFARSRDHRLLWPYQFHWSCSPPYGTTPTGHWQSPHTLAHDTMHRKHHRPIVQSHQHIAR